MHEGGFGWGWIHDWCLCFVILHIAYWVGLDWLAGWLDCLDYCCLCDLCALAHVLCMDIRIHGFSKDSSLLYRDLGW